MGQHTTDPDATPPRSHPSTTYLSSDLETTNYLRLSLKIDMIVEVLRMTARLLRNEVHKSQSYSELRHEGRGRRSQDPGVARKEKRNGVGARAEGGWWGKVMKRIDLEDVSDWYIKRCGAEIRFTPHETKREPMK